MSTLQNFARTRVPRFAEAAVERARLTVVPSRAIGRSQAARTPFVVLVLGLLVAGVVGLLMFNTHMQQGAFTLTRLQDENTTLTAQQQQLAMQLDALRDPQRLAVRAKHLGMVTPAQPAFLRLSDGKVLGVPVPATLDGAVRINPLPSAKPRSLTPKTVVVKVPPRTTQQQTSGATGSASTAPTTEGGRKKAHTTADSGARR